MSLVKMASDSQSERKSSRFQWQLPLLVSIGVIMFVGILVRIFYRRSVAVVRPIPRDLYQL